MSGCPQMSGVLLLLLLLFVLKKIFFRLFSLNFMAMDVLPDEYICVHHTYTWDLKRSEAHTGSPLSGNVCEAACG